MLTDDTLAIVLAGGEGNRLKPLTSDRAKPAVPFGGQYRIIDFTLSNCLNSGLRRILVLTQYKSHSLQEHLRDGWSIFNPQLGEYVTPVPPQMRTGESWYMGTADAIYQNRFLINRSGAKNVIVLSGDHIYRMDYSRMIRQHNTSGADLTIASMEVGLDEARSLGVMETDQSNRIVGFQEKPEFPTPVPGRNVALASMGIYVFSANLLCDELLFDHSLSCSSHDFGKDIIPRLIHTHRVFAHQFQDACEVNDEPYWRDVGTIDAYYAANMDLVSPKAPFALQCRHWPIRNHCEAAPPARISRSLAGGASEVTDCVLGNGVSILGAKVKRSILSPDVMLRERADLEGVILLDDVKVGAGATLRNCIIDKHVSVPEGASIGVDPAWDAAQFTVSPNGVVVVPKGHRFRAVTSTKLGRPATISERRATASSRGA